MKTVVILLIIIAISIVALGQTKPENLALGEQEAAQWEQFAKSEQQLQRALGQAIDNAINQPVGSESQSIHASIQQVGLNLNVLRARRESWLANLQLDRGCKGCLIENGKLIKPPAPAK